MIISKKDIENSNFDLVCNIYMYKYYNYEKNKKN